MSAAPSAERTFISIDMDAFYCAVEQKLDPSLRNEPFIVSQKHVVATLSYEARAYGIKKLASVASAREILPQIREVNGEDLGKYKAVGLQILQWLHQYFPKVERLGLEEFRFEITEQLAEALGPLKRLFRSRVVPDDTDGISFEFAGERIECPNFYFEFDGLSFPNGHTSFDSSISPAMYIAGHFAQHLRDKIKVDLGLDCSIGVAGSKNLAKMATSLNKPHGISVVLNGHEAAFMGQARVASVPGIGHRTRLLLEGHFGVEANETVDEMHRKVSRASFLRVSSAELWDLTMGIDHSDIVPWKGPTQISKEDSFSPNILPQKCMPHLQRLVSSLIVQARTEIVDDGKWVRKPIRFRVTASSRNDGYARRSKTIPLHLGDQLDIQALDKMLVAKAYSMLSEITSAEMLLRVVNVALVMPE